MSDDPKNWTCNTCGNVGLEDGNDGFRYCMRCGARADDFIEMGVAKENLIGGGSLYLAPRRRRRRRRRNASTIKAERLSQPLYDSPNPGFFRNTLTLDAEATPKPQRPIKAKEYFDDERWPSGPQDFGGSNHPFVSTKVTETTLNLQNRRGRNRSNKICKHK